MHKQHPEDILLLQENRRLLADYETIFNNALVGIVFTRDGLITRCNPCCEDIFGYPPGKLQDIPVRALFPSSEAYTLAAKTACAPRKKGCNFGGEAQMQKKSGEHFWCGFSVTQVTPETTPNTIETVWIFQNIDKRMQTESTLAHSRHELEIRIEQRTAKLEATNQMLQAEIQARRRNEEKHRTQQSEMARIARINTAGEMVSALAHELGQPLAAMLNYTHGCLLRLATGSATPEELRQGLVQAVRNAEQAGEIVRRVRRFLHKTTPDKRLHDVGQIVDEITVFLNAEARRQEIALRIRRTDHPLKIMADRIELEQVIVNLVKNAFEAMAASAERAKIVEISCLGNARNAVVIAVADSGPGVPQYLRESIFEPFFTTKNKGMGFGLSICNSLIEANGGRITLGDSWLGGALFEVTLPLGDVQ